MLITVALLDEQPTPAMTPVPEVGDDAADALELTELGLTLGALSADLRTQFGIPDDVKGVAVVDVTSGGSASEKGVQAGDVIVEVGQEPVTSPEDVDARVADAVSAGRKSVLFLIQSGGDLRFVPLAIGG
jgi:serine protease Do